MGKLNIYDSFDTGWSYAKKHGVMLSVVLLLAYLLVLWLTYMSFAPEFWTEYVRVVQSGDLKAVEKLMPYMDDASTKIYVVNVVQLALLVGIMNVAKAKFDYVTEYADLKYMSLPFMTYLKVMGVYCTMLLLIILSMYLYGLPLIYLGTRLLLWIPVILENPDMAFSKTFREALERSRGHFWQFLAFELLCILLMFIGVLVFFVGFFFAAVICIYALMDLNKQTCSISNE